MFAILFGIPYGGEGTVIPVINKQYYGRFPMGTTYGWQLFGAGIGMAIGGFIPGILFDISGSYVLAIWVSSISSFWGALIVLMLRKTDNEIVKAMIRGSQMLIEGTSSRGTETTDTFSLSGFTAAYETANKTCKA